MKNLIDKHLGSFYSSLTEEGVKQLQEACEEMIEEARWETECESCGGHSGFWKTVVQSPQWIEWEKYNNSLSWEDRKKLDLMYDIDECRECGWISQDHFQAFIRFIKNTTNV